MREHFRSIRRAQVKRFYHPSAIRRKWVRLKLVQRNASSNEGGGHWEFSTTSGAPAPPIQSKPMK
jgi:hypothetical protein